MTEYTKSTDGVRLAYQVVGDGPRDLLMVVGSAYPIDLLWENPDFLEFASRLRRFSRTIWPERRGVGASGGTLLDHFSPDIAERDLTVVLDAAQCSRVTLVGTGMRGPLAISYAVNHPERVDGLVLIDTFAAFIQTDDYPWGLPREVVDRTVENHPNVWGTLGAIEEVAPSKANDESFRTWIARCQRLGLSPDDSATGYQMSARADVRALLPKVAVPTLVLHRSGDRYIPVGAGRYLAQQIPGATYVELPGEDHYFFLGDADVLLDEIEEFLTGAHLTREADRALATLLFTDIVSSTQRAAQLGDRKWRTLLDTHDSAIRKQLGRFGGREIDTAGDGFFATFNVPGQAIECARAIREAAMAIGLQLRIGLHAGEIELRGDNVAGMAVHIGARVAALADPGEVLVSSTVKELVVGSKIEFIDRGSHELKGVPGTWSLFAVRG